MGLIYNSSDLIIIPNNPILLRYNPSLISGCILWLDSSQFINVMDGSKISTWFDRSGYNHNAYQSTDANKPTLIKNKFNGLPVVYFNAANSNYMTIDRTANLEPANITMFFAYINIGLASTVSYMLSKPYRTSGWTSPYLSYQYVHDTGVNKKYSVFGITTGSTYTSSNSTVDCFGSGSNIIQMNIFNSTNMRLFTNGQLINTTAKTGNIDYTGGATNLALGVRSTYSLSEYGNFYLAELLLYNRALDSSEYTSIINYLSKKYGVSI